MDVNLSSLKDDICHIDLDSSNTNEELNKEIHYRNFG